MCIMPVFVQASQRGMDRRVVAQLYDCVDQVKNVREAAVSSVDTSTSTASMPPTPSTAPNPRERDELLPPIQAQNASDTSGADGALAFDSTVVVPVLSKPNFVVLIATTNRYQLK
jgi:hypothetical protein